MSTTRETQRGFTLLELALVLVIISLLTLQWLPGITQQQNQRLWQVSEQRLEAAREALISYAILHQNLPCPDYSSDSTQTAYGEASTTCSSPLSEGWLPFRTLGLAEGDGWFGRVAGAQAGRIVYRVDPAFTRSGGGLIRLSTNFSISLSVQDSLGNKLTSDVERPVAILISPGPDGQLNGENARFESVTDAYQSHPPVVGFDDLVIWLGRPSLFNALIRAGLDVSAQ